MALTLAEIWRTYDAMGARLTAPLSARMVELAGLRPGEQVLDVATGRGEPAILAARTVAPAGSVLGIDLSEDILAMAAARASREGVGNLALRVADATSIEDLPAAHFDAALARWGLMFMNEPGAALAPGTFRFADPARTDRELADAGFVVEHAEEVDVPILEAASEVELLAWFRAFGLARLLEGLPADVERAWEEDLAVAAEPFRKDGIFRIGGVTRIVVARRRP